MKKVLVLKDKLSKIDSLDLQSIKEQTKADNVVTLIVEDKEFTLKLISTHSKECSSILAFNNALLLVDKVLAGYGLLDNLRPLIENCKVKKYIYRRDKTFIGENIISMLDMSKIEFLFPTKRTRVLVAVPTYQNCSTETMQSIYNLIEPTNVLVDLMFVTGYTVVQARNRIVKESLSGRFDYTLFVDSDVILPPYLLFNLLNVNSDIATGYYLKKTKDKEITELYGADKVAQNSMVNILKSELPQVPFNILGCGFGCTLVKNSVFLSFSKEDIEKEMWFRYIEEGKVKCSEDLYFCIKAKERGINIVADPNSMCLHVGKMIF